SARISARISHGRMNGFNAFLRLPMSMGSSFYGVTNQWRPEVWPSACASDLCSALYEAGLLSHQGIVGLGRLDDEHLPGMKLYPLEGRNPVRDPVRGALRVCDHVLPELIDQLLDH